MSPSLIIRVVIMLVCIVFAIIGLHKQKEGKEWGKPLATVCAIIATLAALWGIVKTFDGSEMKNARNRELEYQRIQSRVLGKYIAKNFPGKKAVVLVDPMIYAEIPGVTTQRTDPIYEGLVEGLGTSVEIVNKIYPQLPKMNTPQGAPAGAPADMPMDMMIPPTEMWFTAKSLAKIIPPGTSYDIFISLINLPVGSMRVCHDLTQKKIALIGGDTSIYGALFSGGYAVAAVTHNPKAIYDEKSIPRDEMKAFNKRYLLLTKENYKEVIEANKKMFAPMR
ncbi:MAG: hypothetical protein WCS73_01590 [Lentisphaeria bacterium]